MFQVPDNYRPGYIRIKWHGGKNVYKRYSRYARDKRSTEIVKYIRMQMYRSNLFKKTKTVLNVLRPLF